MALSTSPPASCRAALQSIIPAPVRSRRAFTSLALISMVLTGSLPLRPDLAALLRPARPAAAPRRAGWPPPVPAEPPAARAAEPAVAQVRPPEARAAPAEPGPAPAERP